MRSELPSWILHVLRDIGGLAVQEDDSGTVKLQANGGAVSAFRVVSAPVLSLETARTMGKRVGESSHKESALVATYRLAPPTREVLRGAGVSWVERDTGICFLAAPGLLVDRQVPHAAKSAAAQDGLPRLRDRAGLVAEAVLSQWAGSAGLRVAAMAARSTASPAVVSRVFQRLTQLRIFEEHGRGPGRYWLLKDHGALLDLWSQEERTEKQIVQLYVWVPQVRELYEKLSKVKDVNVVWALAGVAAANLYAPTLTTYPEPILRLDAGIPAKQFAEALGGDVVEKGGNITVWQTQGNLALFEADFDSAAPNLPWSLDLPRVSRARAYVETVSAGGRAADVAERLRERMMSAHG